MTIKTRSLVLLSFMVLAPLASMAQEQAAHVYEAYYRVAYSDLDAWNEGYWNDLVPVLESLQEEGIIEGFNQYQHHSGGDYNIRFVARTTDWASIETFWNEYIARRQAAMSQAERDQYTRMIIQHRDEIWDIGEANVPAGFEATHIYSAMFSVNFADMDEWQALWGGNVADSLTQAMDDGLLGGWVRLDHNTGGPYNSKFLFFFDDWDNIDDVIFDRMIGGLLEDHPDEWARLNSLFDEHTDVIWEPTPAPE